MSEFSDAISSYGTAPGQQAVAAANDNPDQAAEAVKLGAATGVDPTIIHGDLDYFKQSLKSTTGNLIIGQYPELQNYIRNNKLAASVSNDDWGKLASFSDAAKGLDTFTQFMQEHDPVSRVGQPGAQAFEDAFQGPWLAQEAVQSDYRLHTNVHLQTFLLLIPVKKRCRWLEKMHST